MKITILLLIINFFCVITTMSIYFTGPYNRLLVVLLLIFWLMATIYDVLSRDYSGIDFSFGEPIGDKSDINTSSYKPPVIEPTVKTEKIKPVPVEDEDDEDDTDNEPELTQPHEPKKPL